MMDKQSDRSSINRNASDSAYGWQFQVGAGIKLMLDNVKEFTALKMEGKNDDIEITMPEGKIYAQAKSVVQMDDQSNASAKIKKALEALSDDAKNDPEPVKLIYITNIKNPLSDKKDSNYDCYNTTYDYDILPEDDKQKIRDMVNDDGFPYESFQIHVLKFFGNGENRFDRVKEDIRTFSLNVLGDSAYGQALFEKWYKLFSLNCADKPQGNTRFEKEKKEIMYPVIVLAIDRPIGLDEFHHVSNFEDYDEICSRYIDLINQRTSEYEFSGSVLGDYNNKKKTYAPQESTFKYEYVNSNWKEYENYFDMIDDSEVREAVTKMTLLTLLTRKDKLNKIYCETNLNEDCRF